MKLKRKYYFVFITLRLEEQIDVSEKLFNTYPILIYPCRIYDHGQHSGQLRPPKADQMCPGTNWGMFNDLGVYGVPQVVREKKRYVGLESILQAYVVCIFERCTLKILVFYVIVTKTIGFHGCKLRKMCQFGIRRLMLSIKPY